MPKEDPSKKGSQRVVDLHLIIANHSELRAHDKSMTHDGIQECIMTIG